MTYRMHYLKRPPDGWSFWDEAELDGLLETGLAGGLEKNKRKEKMFKQVVEESERPSFPEFFIEQGQKSR